MKIVPRGYNLPSAPTSAFLEPEKGKFQRLGLDVAVNGSWLALKWAVGEKKGEAVSALKNLNQDRRNALRRIARHAGLRGSSRVGLVQRHELATDEAQVASADEVNKGEIVLCKVQPQHLILRAFGLGEGLGRRAPRASLYHWQRQRAPQRRVLHRGHVWNVGGCLELIRLHQRAGFDQAATANHPLLVRTRQQVSGDFGECGSDRCGKQYST